ncbi:MAG TPA: hypothetical protein PL182_08590, partial [Pseudobdellovibrionaceae bacterium]|nr:hypothetical protein [Pseudobdellovibrionaceae bacterium]
MSKKWMTIGMGVITALALGACAGKEKTEVVGENAIPSKAEKAAEKRGEHVVSKVTFKKGQSDLTPSAREELTKAVTEAQKMGEIDDVTVAVWSDMEYPGKNRKLPAAQVRLADNRGEKIEDYLSDELDVSGYRVKIHNMGKKPGFLAEYMNTADNRLKNDLVAQGIAPKDGEMVLQNASSSALVFIKLK